MTEVAQVAVVPVVVIRVHTVVHIFRIPGGKTLLAKSAAIVSLKMNSFRIRCLHECLPDTRSTGLAEVLGRRPHRVAPIVSHSLVRDQPIPRKRWWFPNTFARLIKEHI